MAQIVDRAGPGSLDLVFQLHGVQRQHRLILRDPPACGNQDLRDPAGDRRADFGAPERPRSGVGQRGRPLRSRIADHDLVGDPVDQNVVGIVSSGPAKFKLTDGVLPAAREKGRADAARPVVEREDERLPAEPRDDVSRLLDHIDLVRLAVPVGEEFHFIVSLSKRLPAPASTR